MEINCLIPGDWKSSGDLGSTGGAHVQPVSHKPLRRKRGRRRGIKSRHEQQCKCVTSRRISFHPSKGIRSVTGHNVLIVLIFSERNAKERFSGAATGLQLLELNTPKAATVHSQSSREKRVSPVGGILERLWINVLDYIRFSSSDCSWNIMWSIWTKPAFRWSDTDLFKFNYPYKYNDWPKTKPWSKKQAAHIWQIRASSPEVDGQKII